MRYPGLELFTQSVKKFLASRVLPYVDEWENQGNFPNEIFKHLGDAGFLGILVKEDVGGIDGGYEMAAAWCEAFGEVPSVGFTIAVNMHSLVVSHALDAQGSDELRHKWLPKAMKGEAIGAYAFTEPGCGSDLARCKTIAKKDGNDWVISGAKTFITNGVRADFVLLLAKTDPSLGYKGFTTFVVDTKLKGFSVSKRLSKLGWLASDTAELTLDQVRVPESCILGKLGDGWIQASNNLSWERMMLTLTSLGAARACYRQTLDYCNNRPAFGVPISQHEEVKNQLLRMKRAIHTGEILSDAAMKIVLDHGDSRAIAAATKRLVCDELVALADTAIQLHGGYGYTTEYPPERWWRDLRLMPIGGGTREIMANIVAKELFPD